MLQPLEIINLNFVASILEQPKEPISNWLFNKLGAMPNTGLTAQNVKGAFYLSTYDDWRTRRMLNLSHSYITDNVDDRGTPQSV